MADSSSVGIAGLSIGTTTGAFFTFLPSFSEVRRAGANDPGMEKDIRFGVIAATAVAMGTGVIVSSLSGSPVPVVTAAIMCLILASCYQAARKVE